MPVHSVAKDEGLVFALRNSVEESLGFYATTNAVFLSELLVRGALVEGTVARQRSCSCLFVSAS